MKKIIYSPNHRNGENVEHRTSRTSEGAVERRGENSAGFDGFGRVARQRDHEALLATLPGNRLSRAQGDDNDDDDDNSNSNSNISIIINSKTLFDCNKTIYDSINRCKLSISTITLSIKHDGSWRRPAYLFAGEVEEVEEEGAEEEKEKRGGERGDEKEKGEVEVELEVEVVE